MGETLERSIGWCVGRWAGALWLTMLGLALTACTSAPAQATDPTATATPGAEEQASQPRSKVESTATPMATPTPTTTATPASTVTVTVPKRPDPNATPTPRLTPSGPGRGDCFGGALSEEPLQCYVLEQAHAQGLIDVVGVYDAAGLLYVSIREDEVGEEVYNFTRQESFAFVERWPELVPYEKYGGLCDSEIHRDDPAAFPHCYLTATGQFRDKVLPRPLTYENILLLPGGKSARRHVPGWASWSQVWPAASDGVTRSAPDSTPSRDAQGPFDVSDVDVTNFPKMDCEQEVSFGCYRWEEHPDLGIAGHNSNSGGTSYYQIKNPPMDEAGLEAIRREISPCYDLVGLNTYVKDGKKRYCNRRATSTIVIIPVKYDYYDLWRWATVLDRFAVSAGNTLGITDAIVSWNSGGRRPAVVHFDSVPTAVGDDPSEMRETIVLQARGDVHRVAEALPSLLKQLRIPLDAVGIVEPQW